MNREYYGTQLKLARVEAGMTQKEVAMRIQRPQQTIAAWEVGRSQPDLKTFSELLRLYGISADAFLKCGQQTVPQLTKMEYEWIARYRSLDEHGKQLLDAVLAIESLRMEAGCSDVALTAARGGGLSVIDGSAAAAANKDHVQAPKNLDL